MTLRHLLPLLLCCAACGGGPRAAYVRVVEPDGRAYYTHTTNALYSEAGGFLTFRDLVTREEVHLRNGKYSAAPCSPEEVEYAQTAYINDPKRLPEGEYGTGQEEPAKLFR